MEADRLGPRQVIDLIMDTNMLLAIAGGQVAPSQVAEALEASYNVIVPDSVVEELEKLSASPQRVLARRAARALELLSTGSLPHAQASSRVLGAVDDDIVALALAFKGEGRRVMVATSDRGLRRRLRRHGIPTLYYRESEGILEAEWLPL